MAATGVMLPAEYTITFAITPLGVIAGFSNVFRFTKSSNDCCEYFIFFFHTAAKPFSTAVPT